MIVDRRIGNINALRRRAPHSWPRPRDITSQTRTPAASGADGTARVAPGALAAATFARAHQRTLHRRDAYAHGCGSLLEREAKAMAVVLCLCFYLCGRQREAR